MPINPRTKRISKPGTEMMCTRCQWTSQHHEYFTASGACNYCAEKIDKIDKLKEVREELRNDHAIVTSARLLNKRIDTLNMRATIRTVLNKK